MTTTTYTLVINDQCETPNVMESFNINVYPTPIVDFSASLLESCKPLITTFSSVVTPFGCSCLWDFGDNSTSTICDTVHKIYSDTGCYDISLTAISNQGCSTNVTKPQYVCSHEIPIPNFHWEPDSSTIMNTLVQFFNTSYYSDTNLWEIEIDGEILNFNTENVNYVFPNLQPGEYPVCLTAISDFGCDSTTCGLVKIHDQFFIYTPNAFTPGDADLINNEFKPVVYGADEGHYLMQIYNRVGQLIYESRNLSIGWDGKHNGVLSPLGVYVWKINIVDKITMKNYLYMGNVTLVR